ncbi:hypothetical protein M728_001496 [Ensifer sp. WSM1721]
MRAIVLLLAISTLCACSQTGRPDTERYRERYYGGQGEYYTGVVPPTPF